ncbi:hypothetical protein B0H16DRAFT_1592562 [Mycena metata]|uniref:Arrestin-like N-terminal domain-containing protein n=1 Tax=Mycena metata TaxID=1033252 RepID=A0AAD7HRF6_9AGAR|nr:hypothetical protein B0H16DRAFT_1592562 [Mycena metata]
MNSPPVYRSTTSLPSYSPRDSSQGLGGSRGSTEHKFTLKDKKNKTRATLKVFSSAPTPAALPTFLEGDKITGSLELNLPRGEKISGASILVCGEVTTGAHTREKFLDISVPLWSRASGNTPSPALPGDCRWTFSVPIPKDVVLPDFERPGGVRSYTLPQTFLERSARVSAHYFISAKIARSFFREDDELQTMFVYVPALRPGPPSMLRQLAYQENMHIPGPDIDGDGWETLPAVTVKGTVFNDRAIEVQCVLSLSKPLSYTRGSSIPCSITYLCRDPQALNLLCTPRSIDVRLQRQVNYHTSLSRTGSWAGEAAPFRSASENEDSGRAVWWQVDNGPRHGEFVKTFHGEIWLAKTLKPTSAISHFAVTYFVVAMPFEVTGFSSADTGPLIRQEVNVGTIFAKGPRPRSYAPRVFTQEGS